MKILFFFVILFVDVILNEPFVIKWHFGHIKQTPYNIIYRSFKLNLEKEERSRQRERKKKERKKEREIKRERERERGH